MKSLLTVLALLVSMSAHSQDSGPQYSNDIVCRSSNEMYLVDLTKARYEVIEGTVLKERYDISYSDPSGFDYGRNGHDIYRLNVNGSSNYQLIFDFESKSYTGIAYVIKNGVKKKLSNSCIRRLSDRSNYKS